MPAPVAGSHPRLRVCTGLNNAILITPLFFLAVYSGWIFYLAIGFLHVNPISGEAHELVPPWLLWAGAGLLAAFLAWSLGRWAWRKLPWTAKPACCSSLGCSETHHDPAAACTDACGCDDADHSHEHEPATAASPSCGCSDHDHPS